MVTTLFRIALVSLCAVAAGGTSRAAFLTGDPVANGWFFAGSSLNAGTYIRGSGNFSFDMYRAQLAAGSGNQLDTLAGWTTGDIVLGMGGLVTPPTTANLTTHARIVSKFTSSPNAWSASTTTVPPGDGLGSFSSGHGGLGSVLIGTDPGSISQGRPGGVTATGGGTLTLPFDALQFNGTGSNALDLNVARYIYTVDGFGLLRSWEVLLNVSFLNRLNTGFASPTFVGRWNQALQRGTSTTDFTDGLNVPTPLPATALAFAAGAGLLGLGRFGRRRAGM